MARSKGLRKQIRPVLIEQRIYDVLTELREFSGLPVVQLISQLFEYEGLIKPTILNNFFDEQDTPHGKRRFKEWKQLKQQKDTDNGNDPTSD